MFIEATQHAKHKINYERALELFTLQMSNNDRE
ncbi:Uncharacterised protein [Klebsiella variicola]|nr:Uncharacterised protein [Klebsiella variicola]SLW83905.1 Uncharacterised protein [Klebsiella variicola]SLY51229.1 Uncharacterised protein [Klebsiella variicola]SMA31017.1 Uncharacterised protein [Klebsiella variicola]SMA32269.1 Uncharacterised protein [Klebsiella variicola]